MPRLINLTQEALTLIALYLDEDEQDRLISILIKTLNLNLHGQVKQLTRLLPILEKIPELKPIIISYLTITRLTGGLTNETLKISFSVKEKEISRILRIVRQTFKLIDREAERFNASEAGELGLNASIRWQNEGAQLSEFLYDTIPLDHLPIEPYLRSVANMLTTLHRSTRVFRNVVNLFERNLQWYNEAKKINEWSEEELAIFQQINQQMIQLETVFNRYPFTQASCHLDPNPGNFLFFPANEGNQGRLIDWEYAGVAPRDYDSTYFCIYANLTSDQIKLFLEYCYPDELYETAYDRYLFFNPIALYWSSLWFFVFKSFQPNEKQAEFQMLANQYLRDTKNSLQNEEFQLAMQRLSRRYLPENQGVSDQKEDEDIAPSRILTTS